jgi:adhesin transport system outer membrane protein
MRFQIIAPIVIGLVALPVSAHSQSRFSINDALKQAVATNPGVGKAAANRRATESELRQQQSTLLPQVRVEGRWGAERFNQNVVPAPLGNGNWMNAPPQSLSGNYFSMVSPRSTRSGVRRRA